MWGTRGATLFRAALFGVVGGGLALALVGSHCGGGGSKAGGGSNDESGTVGSLANLCLVDNVQCPAGTSCWTFFSGPCADAARCCPNVAEGGPFPPCREYGCDTLVPLAEAGAE